MAEKLLNRSDERDELKDLESQIAELEEKRNQKRFVVESNENFGKYDITAPAEGEETYTSYMESRPKDGVGPDANGKLRNMADGTFASLDDYFAGKESEGKYYNRMIEEGDSEEKSFADMSMIEIAKKLGEYHDDRSMSGELMSILQEKVDEYAEKYGWSEEAKNAHMDKLLAISLRNTEKKEPTAAELDVKTATEINEALKKNPELAKDPRILAELEALRRALDGEVDPLMEPFGNKDVVVHDPAEAAARKALLEDEAERSKTTDDEEAERKLREDEAERAGFEESDDAEAEAARKALLKDEAERSGSDDEEGAHTTDPQEVLREQLRAGFGDNPVPEIYDNLEEEESQPRGRFNWAKRAYARAGALYGGMKESVKEKLRGMDRDKKIGLGIGAVALVGLATYAAFRLGHHDHHHTTGGGSIDNQPGDNSAADMKADYDAKRHAAEAAGSAFSPEALRIDSGEGWLRELSQMGLSPKEANDLLPKILNSHDKALRTWTYLMKDGNPGISHPGKIPPSVLESIQELRNQ